MKQVMNMCCCVRCMTSCAGCHLLADLVTYAPRVRRYIRHADAPEVNVSSATTPPASSAPADSVTLPFATTQRAAPAPDTIFGLPGLVYRDLYERAHDTEGVFEHFPLSSIFFLLATLFKPHCNRSSGASKLQPDWAFLSNRRSGHLWFCS